MASLAPLAAAALALVLAAAAPPAAAQAPGGPAAADSVAVPPLAARVTDLTGTLADAERAALEDKLRAFEQARGSQVAVLMVPTLGSEVIEEFAGRVADTWQLGRKGVDDGVLFVVALKERRMRIHTGRGVQGTLTDALSKRIVWHRNVHDRYQIVSFDMKSGEETELILLRLGTLVGPIHSASPRAPIWRGARDAVTLRRPTKVAASEAAPSGWATSAPQARAVPPPATIAAHVSAAPVASR